RATRRRAPSCGARRGRWASCGTWANREGPGPAPGRRAWGGSWARACDASRAQAPRPAPRPELQVRAFRRERLDANHELLGDGAVRLRVDGALVAALPGGAVLQ